MASFTRSFIESYIDFVNERGLYLPYIEASLIQAMHDFHFGNRHPVEKVAVLVLNGKSFMPEAGDIERHITDPNNLASVKNATTEEVERAGPIVFHTQSHHHRGLITASHRGDRSIPITSSRVEYFIKQVNLAYSLVPSEKVKLVRDEHVKIATEPTPEEMKQGLQMLAQRRRSEFCNVVARMKHPRQIHRERVLKVANRLQILVCLLDYEDHRLPWGMRILMNASQYKMTSPNAFAGTALHHDLKRLKIKRLVIMGERQHALHETIRGVDKRGRPSSASCAIDYEYTVMIHHDLAWVGLPSDVIERYTEL